MLHGARLCIWECSGKSSCMLVMQPQRLISDLSCRQPLVAIITANSRVRPVVLIGIKIFHAGNATKQNKVFIRKSCANDIILNTNTKRQRVWVNEHNIYQSSVPICKWLWETSLSKGGEVQSVRLLVHPARLDVQVLEDVHFSLETNLKQTRTQVVSRVSQPERETPSFSH